MLHDGTVGVVNLSCGVDAHFLDKKSRLLNRIKGPNSVC